MLRTRKWTALLACVGFVSGCSIAGTWKTVSVKPEELSDKFSFSTVTFDSEGMYSGTIQYGGEEKTTTGKYEWDPVCGCLVVKPKEGNERVYKGELWWFGTKLCLHHDHEGTKMTGVLEKQPG